MSDHSCKASQGGSKPSSDELPPWFASTEEQVEAFLRIVKKIPPRVLRSKRTPSDPSPSPPLPPPPLDILPLPQQQQGRQQPAQSGTAARPSAIPPSTSASEPFYDPYTGKPLHFPIPERYIHIYLTTLFNFYQRGYLPDLYQRPPRTKAEAEAMELIAIRVMEDWQAEQEEREMGRDAAAGDEGRVSKGESQQKHNQARRKRRGRRTAGAGAAEREKMREKALRESILRAGGDGVLEITEEFAMSWMELLVEGGGVAERTQ